MEAPRLTLLPFLSHWDPASTEVTLNILTIPIGDPRNPLAAAAPAPAAPSFVGAAISLAPHISTDALTVPTLADVPSSTPIISLNAPTGQQAIFNDLASQFNINQPQPAFERQTAFRLAKYLPHSYRGSFNFTAPKTELAVVDDSYLCALRCPPETPIVATPPSTDISWGEAFAMLIRHPAMARAAGLLHTVTINLNAAFPGGWIFFSLSDTSPFAQQAAADPSYLRTYATRVPTLDTSRARPIFTAVSFPVAADAAAQAALGSLDEVFDEAISFDDGFAKIVHARQPETTELAADDGSGLPLMNDMGIQLGWDDEDVLIGMNRGIGDNPDGTTPPEAPSGVAGYRIDVRTSGTTQWTSLCQIAGSSTNLAGVALGSLDAELNVEVQPTQVNNQFWLPMYYTRWEGGSLVAPSDQMQRLAGIPPRTTPLPYSAVGEHDVPLRYGNAYEFRVRLSDVAGGGPGANEDPEHPASAPIAKLDMRRNIRPNEVRLGAISPDENRPTSVDVRRPLLGYPAALYTGNPQALSVLDAIATANQTATAQSQQPIAIPDPDTSLVRVDVFVEMPGFDQSVGSDGFKLLSRTYRAFPELTDLTAETALTLNFNWVTAARLSDISWTNATTAVADTGPIDLPTARNVRVELSAVAPLNLTYFANEKATIGRPEALWEGTLRVAEPESEPLFGPIDNTTALTSVFLQPDTYKNALTWVAPSQSRPSPLLVSRLASTLEFVDDSGSLYAPPGQRVVFSCNGITHTLAPDASSLTFTTTAELAQVWINTLRVPIARDWSWIGLANPGITVKRTTTLNGKAGSDKTVPLASFSIPHSVNMQATSGEPDRDNMELIIVDVFTPPLDENGHPHEVTLSYELYGVMEAGGQTPPLTITSRLPVATKPRIAPRLVSAGHALSPYSREANYAETGDRERRLWLEFTEDPRQDPRDVLYGRVLALSPDPMLLPVYEPDADPPTHAELDLDPEKIRVIRPEQAEDFAGLSAMQALIPSPDSPKHFAVPLPPSLGPGSPELFGFFTMEFRLGHPKSTNEQPFWSTAQGRFGPPLVTQGVQFPAPPLQVSVRQQNSTYIASAEFAQPVRRGRHIPLSQPNTDIWFVLYARVMQADGKTMRNIQLLTNKARLMPNRKSRNVVRTGSVFWSMDTVESALATLGLGPETPLSTLGVELLPEPNSAFLDPLGGDLGDVRILRTSRLVEVPLDCCVV